MSVTTAAQIIAATSQIDRIELVRLPPKYDDRHADLETGFGGKVLHRVDNEDAKRLARSRRS